MKNKENYQYFLSGEAWKEIRERKVRDRRIQGSHQVRCEISEIALDPKLTQAHHIWYPEKWEDTKNHHLLLIAFPIHKVIHEWMDGGRLRKERNPKVAISSIRRALKEWDEKGMPTVTAAEDSLKGWVLAQIRKSQYPIWLKSEKRRKPPKVKSVPKSGKRWNKQSKILSDYSHIINKCDTITVIKISNYLNVPVHTVLKLPREARLSKKQSREVLRIANRSMQKNIKYHYQPKENVKITIHY